MMMIIVLPYSRRTAGGAINNFYLLYQNFRINSRRVFKLSCLTSMSAPNLYGNDQEKIFVIRGGQRFEKRSSQLRVADDGVVVNYQPDPEEAKRGFFSKLLCGTKKKYDVVQNFTKSMDAPDLDFHANCFIKLTHGVTAYRLIEPSTATDENAEFLPVIVCLHGMYNSSYMWADVADLLCDCEQGPNSRVLVFDFYGRGRSPWTGVQCSLDVLVTQTKELLDVLGLTRTYISLIGFDLGGAVATGFSAKYPDLTTSVTLIAPMGMRYLFLDKEKMLKRPYFGEFMMYNRRVAIAQQQVKDFYNVEPDAPHRDLITKQVAMVHWQVDNTPGYLGAVLSTVRTFPIRGMDELYTAVGRHSRPILVLWGEYDKICPYRSSIDGMEQAFPKGYIVDIRDCGHNPIAEKFDETMTEILAFHKQTYDTIIEELARSMGSSSES